MNAVDTNSDQEITIDEYIIFLTAERPPLNDIASGETGDDDSTSSKASEYVDWTNIYDFNLDGDVSNDEQSHGEVLVGLWNTTYNLNGNNLLALNNSAWSNYSQLEMYAMDYDYDG